MYKLFINRIRKAFRLSRNALFQLFDRPLIINASVAINYDGSLIHANWGDDINYYFLKQIIKRPFIFLSEAPLSSMLNSSNYLTIGSTIGMFSDKRSIIWGAGIMDSSIQSLTPPRQICAVRGPRTRAKLLELGIECPYVYGDPALLLPMYYKPDIKKKYKIGIIAHYTDQDVAKKYFKDDSRFHFIDIVNYEEWHNFIDEILSCESIVSSSLHGLIVAEAYKIPSLWIEFENDKQRDHFKYYDFYESIGKYDMQVFHANSVLNYDCLVNEIKKWSPGEIDLVPLIKSAPFELKDVDAFQNHL